MTNAPDICNCCKEPIQGATLVSCGVGSVCRDCGRDLRQAVGELEKKGMRGLFLGDCPDNRKLPGKEGA